jgi:hypothetical protein
MYPREQSSRRDQRSKPSTIISGEPGAVLRPVALPALAAAVRVVAAPRKSTRTSLLTGTRDARFEHEDTPLA